MVEPHGRRPAHTIGKITDSWASADPTYRDAAVRPPRSRSWPLVLLPVQIASLELIIDPACSIVFESEQIDPASMSHPPRAAGEELFGRRVLIIAGLQGVAELAAVLGAYLWFRERSNRALKWILSITSAVLVVLLTVPRLRTTFHFGPLRALDWAVAVAAGLLGVGWFEIDKARRAAGGATGVADDRTR